MVSLLKRATRDGFHVLSVDWRHLNPEEIQRLIPSQATVPERAAHQKYLTSGPCAVVWLHRDNGIYRLQSLLGPDDPLEAKKTAEFSLRAVYGSDLIENGYYGTQSYASALVEAHHFGKCHTYEQLCEGKILGSIGSYASRVFTRARLTLNETVCFGIPPVLYADGSYVAILERLVREKYSILNVLLIDLTEKQLVRLHEWVGTISDLNTPGVWVIMALDKDNAISRTKRLIGTRSKDQGMCSPNLAFRGLKEECLANLYGSCHVSDTMQQSQRELMYFFGQLYGGNGDQITSSDV